MINKSKSSLLKMARDLYTKKIDSELLSQYELVRILISAESMIGDNYAKLYLDSFPSGKSPEHGEDRTKDELNEMIDVCISAYIKGLSVQCNTGRC